MESDEVVAMRPRLASAASDTPHLTRHAPPAFPATQVWMATATCNFGPRRHMYPWSGCRSWDLPLGSYFSCRARNECANVSMGSPEAEAITPSCGSDYSLQSDGTRRRDAKAVKSAVDEFAKRKGRQVQLAYRDNQRAFLWNTWAMRR